MRTHAMILTAMLVVSLLSLSGCESFATGSIKGAETTLTRDIDKSKGTHSVVHTRKVTIGVPPAPVKSK